MIKKIKEWYIKYSYEKAKAEYFHIQKIYTKQMVKYGEKESEKNDRSEKAEKCDF